MPNATHDTPRAYAQFQNYCDYARSENKTLEISMRDGLPNGTIFTHRAPIVEYVVPLTFVTQKLEKRTLFWDTNWYIQILRLHNVKSESFKRKYELQGMIWTRDALVWKTYRKTF